MPGMPVTARLESLIDWLRKSENQVPDNGQMAITRVIDQLEEILSAAQDESRGHNETYQRMKKLEKTLQAARVVNPDVEYAAEQEHISADAERGALPPGVSGRGRAKPEPRER